MKTCTIPECDKKFLAKGLCANHYARKSRSGSPTGTTRPTVEQRFWAMVDKTDTCWLWTGKLDPCGYGRFRAGDMWMAHRFAYEHAVGPIPDGLAIDHRCHTRACVNPEHLRPVTNKQNMENQSGPHGDSKSGVRGVHWRENVGKWRAQVVHNRRSYNVGYFSELADAEAAVRAKRLELFTHNELDRVA